MTGKVIAVANMKGGVGKTTTVIGLAEALAAGGASVLVVDLDAQASASFFMVGDERLRDLIQSRRTISSYLQESFVEGDKVPLAGFVEAKASEVSHAGQTLRIGLLASSPYLRDVERDMIVELARRDRKAEHIEGPVTKRLTKQLGKIAADVDYVLIDCAPGISVFTEVAIRLADLVIVPTIPDLISTLGLEAFCQSLWHGPIAQLSDLPAPKGLPHVLATKVQGTRVARENLEKMHAAAERDNPTFNIFSVHVPQATAFVQAMEAIEQPQELTFRQKWKDQVRVVLDDLAEEVKGRLHALDA